MLNPFAANVDVSFGKKNQVKDVDIAFYLLPWKCISMYSVSLYECGLDGGRSMGWASNGKLALGTAGWKAHHYVVVALCVLGLLSHRDRSRLCWEMSGIEIRWGSWLQAL